ncbi:MAG: ATP-binding protein [Proteobacteria bacterium]|nr:ATP-binding protein [Pseudomonadota bacterium]
MKKTTSLNEVAATNFGFLAKMTVLAGKLPLKNETKGEFLSPSENGQDVCDLKLFRKELEKDAREAAIGEHGNDPNTRCNMSGIPANDREFMFAYDYRNAVVGVDFERHSWDWMCLIGTNGTGKTTLATRLAWEWMKRDPVRKVTFLSIVDWIRNLQLSFGRSKYDENYVEELPSFKPFVILDDFDKIQYTEWQILQLFRLVDYLYRSDKKVVFTCNTEFPDILKKSDSNGNMKATIDRIKGRAKGSIIGMNGKSYR